MFSLSFLTGRGNRVHPAKWKVPVCLFYQAFVFLPPPPAYLRSLAFSNAFPRFFILIKTILNVVIILDLEAEADPPDWRHSIPEEELHKLSPKELKRQVTADNDHHGQTRTYETRIFCRKHFTP